MGSDAPEPSQDVRCENGYSSACGNAGESLLRAGFAVGELVTTKNNSNEAGDFCNCPGKQGLHGGEAPLRAARPTG